MIFRVYVKLSEGKHHLWMGFTFSMMSHGYQWCLIVTNVDLSQPLTHCKTVKQIIVTVWKLVMNRDLHMFLPLNFNHWTCWFGEIYWVFMGFHGVWWDLMGRSNMRRCCHGKTGGDFMKEWSFNHETHMTCMGCLWQVYNPLVIKLNGPWHP